MLLILSRTFQLKGNNDGLGVIIKRYLIAIWWPVVPAKTIERFSDQIALSEHISFNKIFIYS